MIEIKHYKRTYYIDIVKRGNPKTLASGIYTGGDSIGIQETPINFVYLLLILGAGSGPAEDRNFNFEPF